MAQTISYTRLDGSTYAASEVPDDVDASFIERMVQRAYDKGRSDQAERIQSLVSESLRAALKSTAAKEGARP